MTKRLDCSYFDWLDWSADSFMSSRYTSSKQSAFQTDRKALVIYVSAFPGLLEKAQHSLSAATEKPSNLLYYCNQKWNSSKPSCGHQKGECEADKTQQVTQESSLIIGGFSWASDVVRSELQSYYEMISHNVKWFPDLLKSQRRRKENILLCQYFCLVHLGV